MSGPSLGPGKKGRLLPLKAPQWYPKSTRGNVVILLACTIVTAGTQGYDGAMMGGLNMLPQYANYFDLTPATRSLALATYYVGGCLACTCWGWLSDAYGRRVGLFWAAVITCFATALQAGAQHIAMFVVARVLVGFGTTASAITGPAYLAETLPWHRRAWGLALFDDLFYVGALTAAGVTYASFGIAGPWAWRLPSLVQGVWGLACVALLPWMPESPRWLVDQGRGREALEVLARVNAGGNTRDDLVRLQFREIFETLEYERHPLTWRQMVKGRGPRRRLVITATCALFSMLTGNVSVAYFIGKMLDKTGLRDPRSAMLVYLGLNGCSLVSSLCGSFYTDRKGVKSAALISTAMLSAALFALGALTRAYGQGSDYAPGIWATVSMIFLFSAAYGFGWIPILFLVPAEMLNFSIRATGMSLFSFVVNITGIWATFAVPLALDALGWRFYMINAASNMAILAFIAWYWVELTGKTLEEIDSLFDGVKHSDAPDVEAVLAGTAEAGWKKKLAVWMRSPRLALGH